MFRRGKWDLPKGKLDPGESLETCAQREVKEETGISHLELIRFLLVTEHEYEERGKLILKETHWWLMKTSGNQKLIPQTEEDITELKWIGPSDFKMVLAKYLSRHIGSDESRRVFHLVWKCESVECSYKVTSTLPHTSTLISSSSS